MNSVGRINFSLREFQETYRVCPSHLPPSRLELGTVVSTLNTFFLYIFSLDV